MKRSEQTVGLTRRVPDSLSLIIYDGQALTVSERDVRSLGSYDRFMRFRLCFICCHCARRHCRYRYRYMGFVRSAASPHLLLRLMPNVYAVS